MRTGRQRGKFKKSVAARMKTNVRNTEGPAAEQPDLSQLRQPIETNLSTLTQVVELLDKGTEEVQSLLKYECDVIYECRTCRSLFRSLANFVSHKRVYCLEKHNMVHCRRPMDPAEPIDNQDIQSNSEASVDTDYKENCSNDRTLRSQATRKQPKQDLTSVVAMLTKRINLEDKEISQESQNNTLTHITNDNEQVLLEIIDENQAAYQTVLRPDNSSSNEDLMKTQALELKSMLNRDTAVLGPNGQLLAVDESPTMNGAHCEKDYSPADKKFPGEAFACETCGEKFATKKTRDSHVSLKHKTERTHYPCPCCSNAFSTTWGIYRHLYKVHKKTMAQVRKMRSQILPQAVNSTSPPEEARDSEPTASNVGQCDDRDDWSIEDLQNSMHHQEWVNNMELDTELQRCGACGQRFDHKTALMRHLMACEKRLAWECGASDGRAKRASKEPPQRLSANIDETIPSPMDHEDEEDSEDDRNNEKSSEPTIADLEKPNYPSKNAENSSKANSATGKSTESMGSSDARSEISIRVEEVSSLSKDVWDKMGTNENRETEVIATPVKKAPISSVKISSQQKPAVSSAKDTPKKVPSSDDQIADEPEVIYTTIDNSQPVALSGLSTQQKLGIQYRGIRLPTVTLEKINVPRYQIKASSIEPSVTMKIAEDRPISNNSMSQPGPLKRLQCTPCDRWFPSVGNLRRHLSYHFRRKTYRCTVCDYKSMLKCVCVAHCNTLHDAKNNKTALADMVKEVPFTKNEFLEARNAVMAQLDEATRKEINIAELRGITGTNMTDVESQIMLEKNTKKSVDLPAKSSVQRKSAVLMNEAVKPRRGRPPIRKRGRPVKWEPRRLTNDNRKKLRYVSPPRLSDGSSGEMDEINSFATNPPVLSPIGVAKMHPRAPSRLETDPELRKMVMEVIFGSPTADPVDQSEDSDMINKENNADALDNRENGEFTPPRVDCEIIDKMAIEQ